MPLGLRLWDGVRLGVREGAVLRDGLRLGVPDRDELGVGLALVGGAISNTYSSLFGEPLIELITFCVERPKIATVTWAPVEPGNCCNINAAVPAT